MPVLERRAGSGRILSGHRVLLDNVPYAITVIETVSGDIQIEGCLDVHVELARALAKRDAPLLLQLENGLVLRCRVLTRAGRIAAVETDGVRPVSSVR